MMKIAGKRAWAAPGGSQHDIVQNDIRIIIFFIHLSSKPKDMKIIRTLPITLLLCMAVSCAKEQVSQQGREDEPSRQDKGQASGLRTIKVLFDESTADAVAAGLAGGGLSTRSSEVNGAIAMSGAVRMERLFPHAGEYEERTRREGLDRWYMVTYDSSVASGTKAMDSFSSLPGVEAVEDTRKIKRTADYFFNDPRFSSQWDMYDGKAQTFSVNVDPVWRNYTTGSESVIVGVVDGGIDLTHADLAWNCIAGGSNGSRNFINNTYNVTSESHGTHVAGTIAAVGNNGTGIAGIAGGNFATGAKGVRLMSCQVFDEDDNVGNTAAAIKWAADHGAVIVNNSWGYNFDDNDDGVISGDELTAALAATIGSSDKAAVDYFIKYAGCDNNGNQLPDSPMKGGVVIFAAGNDNIANGAPANYSPIIAVGASTDKGARAAYSNYGDWVDICAPGGDAYRTNILSTLPGNKYGTMQGTSMACPHVTGVAALIASHFGGQGFTNDKLKEMLLGGARDVISTPSSRKIGPLVDAMGSFSYNTSSSAPATVADFTLSSKGNIIDISFNVTASNDGTAAYSYLIAVSEDASLLQGYDPSTSTPAGVTVHTAMTNGKQAGEPMSVRIRDLKFSTGYHVAIIGSSYAGSYSGISPVKAISTKENGAPVIRASEPSPYTIRASEVRPLTFTVRDPEDHDTSVSVDGGSTAATYEFRDSTLTIVLRGRNATDGTYHAVITATDSYGAKSEYPFDYTILPNHAPNARAPFEDVLSYESGTIRFDLGEHFEDEDGDELSYSVRNYTSTGSIGTIIRFNDNRMTVEITGYGLITCDVVASDGAGKECSSPLRILAKDRSNPVELYPNPVVNRLNVRTEGKALTNIRIVSSSGKVLYDETGDVSGFEPLSFDMSGCAPGIYDVSVSYNGRTVKKSIVKK